MLPAGAVTGAADGEVRVALSRAEIKQLPDLPHPQAHVDDERAQQMVATFENAAGKWPAPY